MNVKESTLSEKAAFSSLSELSPGAFTEIAYQILVLLRHRALLKRATAKQLLEPVRINGVVKMSTALRYALAETVRQIETREGKKLEAIPDGKILKYQRTLNSLIFAKAKASTSKKSASGQVVLNRLRSDTMPKQTWKSWDAIRMQSKSDGSPNSAKKKHSTSVAVSKDLVMSAKTKGPVGTVKRSYASKKMVSKAKA
jgi:hypothetical protein